MPPFESLVVLTCGALIGIAMLAGAATLSFRRWLDVRRLELGGERVPGATSAAGRIEIADLKERVRKLEAIAAGVEL